MADLRKILASMDSLNESTTKPVVAEGSMLKALDMVSKSVAPAAELAKEFKIFKEAAKWRADDLEDKVWTRDEETGERIPMGGNDGYPGDELTGRPGSWGGKYKRMTKKGKPTQHELGMQNNTKMRMKMTAKQGGLTGPKGPLPESQVDEGYWDEVISKTEKSRADKAGKPFEKNPASHDKNGVYKGDKDLAGNPVPKQKQVTEFVKTVHPTQSTGHKVIKKTAQDLTNPPKVMQHRAKRDQERDSHWMSTQLAKNESVTEAKRGLMGNNGRIEEGDRVNTPMGAGEVVAILSLSQKVGVLLDSGKNKDFYPEDVEVISQQGVTEDAMGEPSVDDILYYLTSAYRNLQKYADSYQDFDTITRIYENLRYDLKAGDYAGFQKAYTECLSKYPDASVELFDAMFVEAGLPEEQGTIEQFIEKCSTTNEAVNYNKHSFVGKIRRNHELKGKVDSTWDDAVNAEKQGDKAGATRAFNKHVRYTNLERPGTFRDVKDDANESIGDTIKRGVKQVKRGMQGWGGIHGTPSEIVKRNKGHDDQTIKNLELKGKIYKDVDGEPDPHSPQALQNRVVDREMKKRGLGESYGVAEGLVDTQKKIEDTILKLEQRLKFAKTPEQWDNIKDRIERLQAGLNRSKQGVSEGPANDRLKAHAGALVQKLKDTGKKLVAPVKDPILDQMKAISDAAHKRAIDAQNKKYGVFSRTDESAPIKTFALKEDAVALAKRYNKLNPTEGIKYVVRNVSEAMPSAVATSTQKMNPGKAAPAPVAGTGSPSAPGAPAAPKVPGPTGQPDPAVAKAQQAAYQKNIAKLGAKDINASQAGVSMQKQADDMQLTPTDNTNNAKIAGTLAGVLQDPSGAQALKTLTDKYNKKPGQV